MKLRICTLSILIAAAAWSAEPGMVFIPGGEFPRGRSHALPDDGLQWYPEVMKDDRPVKKIRLDAFHMDQHEVTNAEYARFVIAAKHRAPYHWPAGKVPPDKQNHPVANVSWEDAMAYAKWAGKRLPTEAEWERACRGMREGATYSWGETKPSAKLARYGTISGPQDTGKCAANDFGLFDMAGNVWEWTLDWYDRDYYAGAPAENPRGPETGRYRVLRGGSWADVAKYLTCAYRSWARPAERSPNIGFRCVKPLIRK